MTKDDVVRMARDAGIDWWGGSALPISSVTKCQLTLFAAFVAAAEREECSEWLRENFGEDCIATAMISREVWDEENLL